MSFHIHPSENFVQEFKAVGTEQLDLAIAALSIWRRSSEPQSSPTIRQV